MPEPISPEHRKFAKDILENSGVIIIARLIIPALATLLGIALAVIGYFMQQAMTDVKTSTTKIEARLEAIQDNFQRAQLPLIQAERDLTLKLGIIGEKADENAKRLDKIEDNVFHRH